MKKRVGSSHIHRAVFISFFGLIILGWEPAHAQSIYDRLEWKELNRQANDALSAGEVDEALELAHRAVQHSKTAFGARHDHTFLSLGVLGRAYLATGDYAEAQLTFRKVLKYRQGAYVEGHPLTLIARHNLANAYFHTGMYFEAEQLLLDSISYGDTSVNGDSYSRLSGLSDLAVIYTATGEDQKASAIYNDILRITYSEKESLDQDQLSLLHNAAAFLSENSELAAAAVLQQRVFLLRRDLLGGEHPQTLSSAQQFASIIADLGNKKDAENVIVQVLDQYRSSARLSSGHQFALSILASIYLESNRIKEAERLFWEILSISSSNFAEPTWLAKQRGGIASTLNAVEHYSTLAIFYMKASLNELQLMRLQLRGFQVQRQASFFKRSEHYYTTLQSWLIESGRFVEAEEVGRILKEFEYYEFGRSRSGADDPRRSQLAFTKQEQAWQARLDEMAEPVRVAADALKAMDRRQRVGETLTAAEQDELEALNTSYEAAFDQSYADFQAFKAEVASLSEESRRADAAALEEGLQRSFQAEVEAIGGKVAALQLVALEDSLHAFLITPDSFRHVEAEISRSDLYQAIYKVREQLAQPEVDRTRRLPKAGPSASETELMASLQALHDEVLPAELRDALDEAGTETLMLNLQGPLRYVPFAALHDGEAYLTERYTLALYTPAAQTEFAASEDLRTAAGFGVSEEHEGFSPLPAVKRELESLLTGEGRILNGKAYLDAAFTREALEGELKAAPPVVHIASHFSLQPGDDTRSHLLLGDGRRLSLAEFRLMPDFENVSLMTLSACSTGLTSNDGTGAEIEGLGTLVQEKGADAVIATLWNVADETTATFMQRFYQGLASGDLNKAEALQAAQIEMIANPDTSHPYYWAPYILMGNWK